MTMTKQSKRGQKARQVSAADEAQRIAIMRVPRGWLAPARTSYWGKYMKTGVISSATLTGVNQVLSASNAYDVDPLFASTALAGFTEWGALYRFYRVQQSILTIDFSNLQSTEAWAIYLGPANLNLGTGLTSAQATSFMSQPTTLYAQIGTSTGNSDKRLTHRYSTSKFAGAYVAGAVDPYVGPTSGATAPTNQWYWIFGILGGIAATSGVSITVKLECEIEFFEFSNPAT